MNQTPVDLVSIDQIWLGEFAQKGLLTDLQQTQIQKSWESFANWNAGGITAGYDNEEFLQMQGQLLSNT